MKKYIVTPDKHFPLADKKAISVLCKTIEIVKPDGYIDLGDTGEWSGASHWKWKNKSKPSLEWYLPEIITDVDNVNKGMDIIDESLDKANVKEKHFICGNHDKWMDKFVEEYPYLPQYRFERAVKLKERGYKYHPMGKRMKVGKMYFYHGNQYGGQYHSANHLRKLRCNIMYGHWHDIQQHSVTHVDGPKSAWSIGCLKDMADESNSWLQNRATNWAHAFAIIDFYHGGHFSVHVVQIIKGKTSLWGKVLNGNRS